MDDLSDFAHHLRRKASVKQALKRLSEDFAMDESLVLAAAWLGSRGVPPDTILAARLEALVLTVRERTAPADDGSPADQRELLRALGNEAAARDVGNGGNTMPGWFILIAPGSVTCLEQSRWLEAIRNACVQSDA